MDDDQSSEVPFLIGGRACFQQFAAALLRREQKYASDYHLALKFWLTCVDVERDYNVYITLGDTQADIRPASLAAKILIASSLPFSPLLCVSGIAPLKYSDITHSSLRPLAVKGCDMADIAHRWAMLSALATTSRRFCWQRLMA